MQMFSEHPKTPQITCTLSQNVLSRNAYNISTCSYLRSSHMFDIFLDLFDSMLRNSMSEPPEASTVSSSMLHSFSTPFSQHVVIQRHAKVQENLIWILLIFQLAPAIISNFSNLICRLQ